MNLHQTISAFTQEAGDYALANQQLITNIQSKGGNPLNIFTEVDTRNNKAAEAAFAPFVAAGGIFIGEESVSTVASPTEVFASGRDIIVVDPVDGTSPYTRGETSWGVICTHISGGKPVFAIIYLPAHGKWLEVTPQGTSLTIKGMPAATLPTLPYSTGSAAQVSKSAPNLQHIATHKGGFKLTYGPAAAEMTVNLASGASALVGLPAKVGLWDIAALMMLATLHGYSATFEGTPHQPLTLGADMFKDTWELKDNLLITSPQAHQRLYAA